MNKKFIFGMLVATIAFTGIRVSAAECPVKINDTCYDNINAAFNAVPNDGTEVTVKVMSDLDNEPGIGLFNKTVTLTSGITYESATQKNIVLDLNNHTVKMGHDLVGSKGTESQNIHLEKGNTVTIKDGTIISDDTTRMTFQNYSNLTLNNVVLDGTKQQSFGAKYPNLYYVLSNCNGVVKLTGKTSILAPEASDSYAFDVDNKPAYPNGVQLTVDTTGTIKGNIEVTTKDGSTLTIKNGTIEGEIRGGSSKNITIENGSFEKADNAVVPETSVEYTNKEGMNVVVPKDELVVKAFDEVLEPTEEETTKVKEVLSDGYVIGKFFDITAWLTNPDDNNAKVEKVTEVTKAIKVTLNIPTDLPKLKDGYTRTYKVIRIHNGEAKELEVTDNGNGTISFETDAFSPYALTYADEAKPAEKDEEEKTNNPKTVDKIVIYVGALVVCAIAFTGTVIYLNKRYQ